MTSVKSLAMRFYRMKSRHAPIGTYLKWFGHRKDSIYWWCGGGGRTAAQTWEHLFRQCSRWRDHQKALWEAVERQWAGKRADADTCRSLS
jgi:hypothetical protein